MKDPARWIMAERFQRLSSQFRRLYRDMYIILYLFIIDSVRSKLPEKETRGLLTEYSGPSFIKFVWEFPKLLSCMVSVEWEPSRTMRAWLWIFPSSAKFAFIFPIPKSENPSPICIWYYKTGLDCNKCMLLRRRADEIVGITLGVLEP